jgi:DNA-binding NtrC family response regulator
VSSTKGAGFSIQPRTQAQSDGALLLDPGLKERRVQLTVLNGSSSGTVVEVEGPTFTVGKDEAADLVLQDPTVSRHHFRIEQQGGAFVIKDQSSTNGTWIDQFRIKEAYLRPGIVVRAGEVQLRFEPLFKKVDVEPVTDERFGSLVGRSVRMRQIFALLQRVAKTEATCVILGETGAGKSAVARAIHEASERRGGPFVTVDCGAIAENLIESELFGHERGAFTGATRTRQGALEQAQGGTLFIDELADLRLDLQPRLLRVLEEREVRRVGSNDAIKLDVRIIAASRKDLWREVEAGRFREDLYFRLAVFTIPMPALRDRAEDIPLLAREFAQQLKGGDAMLARLSPDRLDELARHPFFGNVRELRNVIERAIHLEGDPNDFLGPVAGIPGGAESTTPGSPSPVPGGTSSEASGTGYPGHAAASASSPSLPSVAVPAAVEAPAAAEPAADATVSPDGGVPLVADCTLPFKQAKERLLDAFEAEYLERLVDRVDGSASAIAREAGIDRKHLYNLAKKHNVDLQKDRG